ncbi:MAG: site-specific integrase [Ignavibacteria bacterium]|nr:site-specific integrase [Ignavibacteria bacterium]
MKKKQFISKDSESGVFYLYYLGADGKRKRRSLKTMDYDEAVKRVENPTETNLMKFKNVVLNYASSNFAVGTCELYKTALDYLITFLGNKDIAEVTLTDLESFKSNRMQFVKVPTVNTYIRIIKASWNIAIKFGLTEKNTARDFKKIKEDQTEKRTFSEEEFFKLLAVVDNPVMTKISLFGYYTGARLGEIINLQWNDIDLTNRVITIRNKTGFRTKTGKIRRIPIADKLYDVIKDMKIEENAEYLFKRVSGEKFSKEYATNAFRRYVKKAKLPTYLHFHSLRHTAITRMITKGVPVAVVQRVAGHANIATTLGYTHLMVDDLRNAMNSL